MEVPGYIFGNIIGYSKNCKYRIASETTDATPTIAAAFAAGFSHVTMEPGYDYTINTQLTIPAGCCLDGQNPPECYSVSLPERNARLRITYSANEAIVYSHGSTVQNFDVYYPNQAYTESAPVTYPATFLIDGVTDWTLKNIAAINPYQLLKATNYADRATIDNIRGHPLYIGLEILNSMDVGHITNVELTPAAVNGADLINWTQANGIALKINVADGWDVGGFTCLGYAYAIKCVGTSYVRIRDAWVEGCLNPLYLNGCTRMHISKSVFSVYSLYPTVTQPANLVAINLIDSNKCVIDDCELNTTSASLFDFSGLVASNYENRLINSHLMTWGINDDNPWRAGTIAGGRHRLVNNIIDGGSNARCLGILTSGADDEFLLNKFRNVDTYAIYLYSPASNTRIVENTFDGAETGITIEDGCVGFEIKNNRFKNSATLSDSSGAVAKRIMKNYGLNLNPTMPAVPASTVSATNTFGYDVQVFLSGGTVTGLYVDEILTGFTTNCTFIWPAGATTALVYSSAPTWVGVRA